jgi:hypothetical protein
MTEQSVANPPQSVVQSGVTLPADEERPRPRFTRSGGPAVEEEKEEGGYWG